jgi:Leucine-rich repeat (LRR) protein/subtilisin family serine protease
MKKKILAILIVFSMFITMASPLVSFAQDFVNPFDNLDNMRKQSVELSLKLSQNTDKKTLEDNNAQSNPNQDIFTNINNCYIVQFNNNVNFQQIYDCVSKYKFKLLAESKVRLFEIEIGDVVSFKNTYANLIKNINKPVKRKVSEIPNDPKYVDQWAIPDMNLPSAWNSTKGSANIKVAVIDTGFYRSHEDISSTTVSNGYDLIANKVGVTSDEYGHGTMVSSVIGATTNNSKGMAGACWNISIVPYKVSGADGLIDSATLISAITMAALAKCDVINMSLGGYDQDPAEQAAIDYAKSQGCIIVASSGNDGAAINPDKGKLSYPASYNGVISVGAVDSTNNRASFSQYNNMVDVCAPGQEILVATKDAPNSYLKASGTSFSSPYVAAVAALARSVEPNINADSFEKLIQDTSTDLGTPSKDDYYGWGLIDAKKVVDAAQKPIVMGVENGGFYIEIYHITFNKGTATLDGVMFNNGDSVTAQGKHKLIVTDSSGNSTTVNFAIDMYVIDVKGVEDGRIYNSDVTITFNDFISATFNGVQFNSGDIVKNEGKYTLVLTDIYGKTKSIKFEIDKTPPIVTGVTDGVTYSAPVTISFNEGVASLKNNPNSMSQVIESGYILAADGTYELNVGDNGNNHTIINFTIHKIVPNRTEAPMNFRLSKWVLDEVSNTLFAITQYDNSLILINANTLNIDSTIPLNSIPTDIIKDNGKLYIALDSDKKIVVVDIASKTIEKTITATSDPNRIVKDGNKLYYATKYSRQLFEINLDTNANKQILVQGVNLNGSSIAVNTNLHILYIDDTFGLVYIDLVSGQIIDKFNCNGSNSEILYDGKNVYFNGRAFKPNTPTQCDGDYSNSESVIYSKNGCVFTLSSIYNQDTHIKAGDFDTKFALAESSTTGNIYFYDYYNHRIVKYSSSKGAFNIDNIVNQVAGAPTSLLPINTVSKNIATGQKALDMKSNIIQWVQDDTSKTLYAISDKDKALFFINSKTLNMENVLRFTSQPTDIKVDYGNLYIAFDDVNQIKIMDIATKTITKTIYTKVDSYKFVIDGNNLYYTQKDQWCDTYEYNLTTNVETILNIGSLSEPGIAINTDSHILYLGESNISTAKLIYYDTVNKKVICQRDDLSSLQRNLVFDGTYVFYAGNELDPADISTIYGTLENNENVLFVKYGCIFTNKSLYSEYDFSKIMDFASPIDNAEVDGSQNLFTYDKTNAVITRYAGYNDVPIVTGVTDGSSYLNPVTITFDVGTALLDGVPFNSGNTVSSIGDHILVVTDDSNGLSTTVNFTIYAPQSDDNTAVAFGDINLKNALIGSGVDLNNDGILTRGEMRIMPTEMYLDNLNITHLTGLEYAVNLKSLSLYQNNIDDITAISSLTKLQYLDLGVNKIVDISKLTALTNLNDLWLNDNQITNIYSLSGLTNLGINDGYLSLSGNKISNISALSGLVNLTLLDLSKNNISDISYLRNLTKLTNLYLADNQITNITSLSTCTSLGLNQGTLDLSNNQISDIGSLSGLINLTDLILSGNKVTNLVPLQSLSNLMYLSISNNGINNLNYISNIKSITYLDVSSNNLTNINALSNFTGLQGLMLSGNKITDFSALKDLTSLNDLEASNCGISNIGVLGDISILNYLDLSNNNITNLAPLSNCSNLRYLTLSKNSISDLSPLSNLTNLGYLDLSNNKIQNINPLSAIASLNYLDLSSNKVEFLDNLKNLSNLGYLDISNNEIGSLDAIKDLTLSSLYAENNYINTSPSSSDMTIINSLINASPYSDIVYLPQKDISTDIAPVITVNQYTTTPINKDITVSVTSNKGKLNTDNHTFTTNGSFNFVCTDGAGKTTTKTVMITNIDKTAPIITVNNYDGTTLTNKPITVTATTNKGTLNATNHTFTENGSFNFVATDAAGNATTKTVTINNIIKYVKGDITGDGKVDALDLLQLKKYLLKQVSLSSNNMLAADVTGDGKVDALDLLQLKKYLLGQVRL